MSGFIAISEGTSLAFHGLALIAENGESPLSVKSIADSLGASEAHLSKVFQRLSREGIISSVRGPSGGYVLNRSAREISLLEVYEILEAPADLSACPLGKSVCSFKKCIFSQKMMGINREIEELLGNIRISDFSSEANE